MNVNEMSIDMDGINKMYRKLYWTQIFNRKTKLGVKLFAIKSLWAMKKINA